MLKSASLLTLAAAALGNSCTFKAWNGITYDLSPLEAKTLSWTGQDNPAQGFATFDVGVCKNIVGDCTSHTQPSFPYHTCAVRQQDQADNLKYNLGQLQGETPFINVTEVSKGTCLGIHYTNGEDSSCAGGKHRDTYVYFTCDEKEEGTITHITENDEDACTYRVYVNTKHACPCVAHPPAPSPKPSPPPTPVYNKPYIRVGHALPADYEVNFEIQQGAVSRTWKGLKYRDFSDWAHNFATGNGTVTVTQTNGTILAKREIFLTPGPLVVIINMDINGVTHDITPIAASYAPSPAGHSRVRLGNLYLGGERLTLRVTNAGKNSTLENSIPYPDASTYAQVAATKLHFDVTMANGPVASFDATAPQGGAFSVYVLGSMTNNKYPAKYQILSDAPLAGADIQMQP